MSRSTMLLLMLAIVISEKAIALSSHTPTGWTLSGSDPQNYIVSEDTIEPHGGMSSAKLSSLEGSINGFGTLMQEIKPDSYFKKRIQFSAYIKCKDVQSMAGLWLRIDGQDRRPVAFDNMRGRPIKGNSNWRSYSIVLVVPANATAIAFGVLLHGSGTVWVDDAHLEIINDTGTAPPISNDIYLHPLKTSDSHGTLASSPVNLDFEQWTQPGN